MWTLSTPWYELIFRATLVYFGIFLLIRIWGKKHLDEMSPFDFILLLIMSEALQNSMVGNDKSVFGGVITIAIFMIWDSLLNNLCHRFEKFELLINGNSRILIKDGILFKDTLNDERISFLELNEAMRLGGVLEISEVKQATLESNGHISVIPYKN